MSRRTAASQKAIRIAWEREQELVSKGQGTRDWTPEQQKTILDPDRGKAYDENEVPFQGQHMKCVQEYPEHEGNPDNIQFLSRSEHLEAHKGSWQNPTNWYYDPVDKQFFDFGGGDPIPCSVINLSNPIVRFDKCNTDIMVEEANPEKEMPCSGADPPISDSQKTTESNVSVDNPIISSDAKQLPPNRVIAGLSNIANTVKELSDKNPVATALVKLGIGAAGIYFTGKAVGSISKSKPSNSASHSALLSQAVDSLGEKVTKAITALDIKNSESFIKQLGYSVAKNSGLSDAERQKLLRETIANGKMLKEAICAYLEFNINLHKNQGQFSEAVSKWIADLEFVKTNL